MPDGHSPSHEQGPGEEQQIVHTHVLHIMNAGTYLTAKGKDGLVYVYLT